MRGTQLSFPFQKSNVPIVIELCEVCHERPKFKDATGFKHQYCGKTCARNDPFKSPIAQTSPSVSQQRRVSSRGAAFASKARSAPSAHLQQTDKCQLCSVEPGTPGICFSCDQLARIGPKLQELNPGSQAFQSVKAEFMSKWSGKGPSPQVEKIYAVPPHQNSQTKFAKYEASRSKSHMVRSYYASQCICDLGVQGPTLCNIKSCGICSTVKSSFGTFAFGAPSNVGRFGSGVYSYLNPAFADKYATTSDSSPYRVVIACDVRLEQGQTGKDKVGKEESIFVPHSDGIQPVFILLYRL